MYDALKTDLFNMETRMVQYMASLDERQTKRADVQDLVTKFVPAALDQMKEFIKTDSVVRLQLALIEARLAKIEGRTA